MDMMNKVHKVIVGNSALENLAREVQELRQCVSNLTTRLAADGNEDARISEQLASVVSQQGKDEGGSVEEPVQESVEIPVEEKVEMPVEMPVEEKVKC